jgi:hypothetical protein
VGLILKVRPNKINGSRSGNGCPQTRQFSAPPGTLGFAIKAAFGPNYERLMAVKKKYDPENFFCLNQNIKPQV